MDNAVKILGIKIAKNRNTGRESYTYYFAQPFTQYEKDNAEVWGTSCSSEFSYTRFDVKVGDVVELAYSKGYQDKALLTGMKVVAK